MPRFNVSEVLELARQIEKNGERFYREAEQRFEQPEVKRIFGYLAREEVKHDRTFTDMLAKVGAFEPDVRHAEEYYAYLRAYVDDAIFSEGRAAELGDAADTPQKAVRFAKQREKDSIQFYTEMKNLVPAAEQAVVDEIIEEERRHYVELDALGKSLGDG